MTPHIVSGNTYEKCFQYKVWNNALFGNKKLFLFMKSNLPLCSFCKDKYETVFHLYFYCPNVKNLWSQLNVYNAEDLTLPPQIAGYCFGFSKKNNTKNVMHYNNFFLIFKLCIYRTWEKEFLNVMSLVNQIMRLKKKRKKTLF